MADQISIDDLPTDGGAAIEHMSQQLVAAQRTNAVLVGKISALVAENTALKEQMKSQTQDDAPTPNREARRGQSKR